MTVLLLFFTITLVSVAFIGANRIRYNDVQAAATAKKSGKKTTSAKKQPEELKLTFVVPRKDEETEKAKIRHFTCAFPTDQIHQVI